MVLGKLVTFSFQWFQASSCRLTRKLPLERNVPLSWLSLYLNCIVKICNFNLTVIRHYYNHLQFVMCLECPFETWWFMLVIVVFVLGISEVVVAILDSNFILSSLQISCSEKRLSHQTWRAARHFACRRQNPPPYGKYVPVFRKLDKQCTSTCCIHIHAGTGHIDMKFRSLTQQGCVSRKWLFL